MPVPTCAGRLLCRDEIRCGESLKEIDHDPPVFAPGVADPDGQVDVPVPLLLRTDYDLEPPDLSLEQGTPCGCRTFDQDLPESLAVGEVLQRLVDLAIHYATNPKAFEKEHLLFRCTDSADRRVYLVDKGLVHFILFRIHCFR